jgi:hypothetical protein
MCLPLDPLWSELVSLGMISDRSFDRMKSLLKDDICSGLFSLRYRVFNVISYIPKRISCTRVYREWICVVFLVKNHDDKSCF